MRNYAECDYECACISYAFCKAVGPDRAWASALRVGESMVNAMVREPDVHTGSLRYNVASFNIKIDEVTVLFPIARANPRTEGKRKINWRIGTTNKTHVYVPFPQGHDSYHLVYTNISETQNTPRGKRGHQ